MRHLLLTVLLLLVPVMASAPPLTKEELFELYANNVASNTIATRLRQLYDLVPAGAAKDQAKATLKQDLLAVLAVKVASSQSAAQAASDILDTVNSIQTDVGDTDL